MVSDENEPSCGGKRKSKEKKKKITVNEGQAKKVERRVSKAHLQSQGPRHSMSTEYIHTHTL